MLTAIHVVPIENVSETKHTSYRSDPVELNKAYKTALSKNLVPLAYHTHPTIYPDGSELMKDLNFLEQLNSSIQDKGVTRWCFMYNGVSVRLPELLIVENAKALFIGVYGGLVTPLCFTVQKDKVITSSIGGALNKVSDWATTPERKAVIALIIAGTIILTYKHPKAMFTTFFAAGTVTPPLIFESQDKHYFFGVTRHAGLKICVPALSDSEIVAFEIKAIEAEIEARRIALARQEMKKNEGSFQAQL